MGKKSKKFAKKALKSFVKGNKIFLAALGGAAAGITLASIVGTEKAQQMVRTIENSVASISDKVRNGLGSQPESSDKKPTHAVSHG